MRMSTFSGSAIFVMALSVLLVASCGKPKPTPAQEALAKEIALEKRKRAAEEAAEEAIQKRWAAAKRARIEHGMVLWREAKFDSAFAYMYRGQFMDTIVVGGKVNPLVRKHSKRRLTTAHIEEIRGLCVSAKLPDLSDISQADCFNPSQGFVFYEGGKITAHISICYSCGRYLAVPEGQALNQFTMAHIFEELGLPVLRDEGEGEEYFVRGEGRLALAPSL